MGEISATSALGFTSCEHMFLLCARSLFDDEGRLSSTDCVNEAERTECLEEVRQFTIKADSESVNSQFDVHSLDVLSHVLPHLRIQTPQLWLPDIQQH